MEGVARLHFNLSPQITSAIEEAKRDVEEQCKSLSVGTLQYKKFGKDYIKKKTLSPDAFFQLAIQVGQSYFILHSEMPCIFADCLLPPV